MSDNAQATRHHQATFIRIMPSFLADSEPSLSPAELRARPRQPREPSPAGKEGDAAQGGDRPQPAWPAQREPVEAPREEDDAQDEEPPGGADPGPARPGHGDGEERERVVH